MQKMRVSLRILMSGIYLHIPFCKQACHYCDFHFSTNTSLQSQLVDAMADEIILQRDYLEQEPVATIYFGGGTPSLMTPEELGRLLGTIHNTHQVLAGAEVTLETNPDDITLAKLKMWRALGINRLSIGIQSFDDHVLKYLNRAHDASSAIVCVSMAREAGFDNFSIDLIYAIPEVSAGDWQRNLHQALRLNPPHISAYTLTIEEKTVFGNWMAKGKMKPVDESAAAEQLEMLMETLTSSGYRQYEISNFAKPGFESRHNSSYWKGIRYLGVGPSAHSYNLVSRQMNVANNHLYIRALRNKTVPAETELLSRADKINEYVLTSLRTESGCDLSQLKEALQYNLLEENKPYINQLEAHGLVVVTEQHLRLSQTGKLLADKIAADLFYQDKR